MFQTEEACMTTTINSRSMDEAFYAEYTANAAVQKYTRATAGYGISYLLDHDYKDIYVQALHRLPIETKQRGIRILEFGCGGGMNLVHVTSVVSQLGLELDLAVGTDFSPVLIDAAKREAASYAAPQNQTKLAFHVARNESLIEDLIEAEGVERDALVGRFDLLIGVNTMRYNHRFGNQTDCARELFELLSPGGVCVNIDMNDRFPAFRSHLKERLGNKLPAEETYIPSLEQYAAPFREVGFTVTRTEHFCWIPHSSGPVMCKVLRGLDPILSATVKTRAMRSLVVAEKPATPADAQA
jgi:SAM-dependent methyltransferase